MAVLAFADQLRLTPFVLEDSRNLVDVGNKFWAVSGETAASRPALGAAIELILAISGAAPINKPVQLVLRRSYRKLNCA